MNAVLDHSFAWSRLRREVDSLTLIIMEFMSEHYEKSFIQDMWNDFYEDKTFDPEVPQNQVFFPWMFFKWTPKNAHRPIAKDSFLSDKTPGEVLIHKWPHRLTEFQKEYITKAVNSPFSFFDIVKVTSGESMTIRNILTSEELDVIEKKGSTSVRPGDIIFCMPVSINNMTVLESLAPIIIRPEDKLYIVKTRNDLKKMCKGRMDNKFLIEVQTYILARYLELYEQYSNPVIPQVRNTDGEKVVPHEIIYRIDDPHEVFEKIHTLDVTLSREEILDSAVLDKYSKVKKVEFSWGKKGNKTNKGWDNTILGSISITPSQLKIDVNSYERSEKIKAILKRLLKDKAKFQNTIITNIEDILAKQTNEQKSSFQKKQKKL